MTETCDTCASAVSVYTHSGGHIECSAIAALNLPKVMGYHKRHVVMRYEGVVFIPKVCPNQYVHPELKRFGPSLEEVLPDELSPEIREDPKKLDRELKRVQIALGKLRVG